MCYHAMEDGEITIGLAETTGEEASLNKILPVKKTSGFQQAEINGLENFAETGKTYTLCLSIHGKIKVAEYEFAAEEENNA